MTFGEVEASRIETVVFRTVTVIGGLATLVLVLGVAKLMVGFQARVVANTSTTWDSKWTGRSTHEAVVVPLYDGEDPEEWAERHKDLVLQAIRGRP